MIATIVHLHNFTIIPKPVYCLKIILCSVLFNYLKTSVKPLFLVNLGRRIIKIQRY